MQICNGASNSTTYVAKKLQSWAELRQLVYIKKVENTCSRVTLSIFASMPTVTSGPPALSSA